MERIQVINCYRDCVSSFLWMILILESNFVLIQLWKSQLLLVLLLIPLQCHFFVGMVVHYKISEHSLCIAIITFGRYISLYLVFNINSKHTFLVLVILTLFWNYLIVTYLTFVLILFLCLLWCALFIYCTNFKHVYYHVL